jgi:cobalt-zinc-cadmium resistance protein CzcA
MKKLVEWAATNRMLAILFALGVCALGGWALKHLPIDAVPDVTNVQVAVVTRAPALSAPEVESQITQPIERAMGGLPGLTQTRSVTKLGISIVTLVFSDDVDVYFARAQVNERLTQIRSVIPEDVGKPEMGPVTTGLGEIYMFELKPITEEHRSDEELRTMVEWQIIPRLRQVPGVIDVVGFGGSVKQYRVTLDPQRMAAHKISAQEVREALERDNRVAGGGYIDSAGEQIVLRGDARFKGIEDISNTIVKADESGVPIRLAQLGVIDTGPGLRQGAMSRDGRGEVVGASVWMLKGRNSRDVVTDVKKALADLAPYLPEGVSIDTYYDRADFINEVLRTIARNLAEGALIVVFCLLLTLGSIRAGLLVAGAIPFSMLVGFVGLQIMGYSGNVMSLGAVDFGIIVEGAVLVVEHAMAHGAAEPHRRKRATLVTHAMMEVARPAVFSVIITLLVFAPLASLEDVEGKMFRPVVISLCWMLGGALVYALVVIPAIGPAFLKMKPSSREPWLVRVARKAYNPALDWSLNHPKIACAAALVITIGLLAPGASIGAEFLPRVFEGNFAMDVMRPPSTSLPQAIALSHETEKALLEAPEVKTVVSRIGRPEGAVDTQGPECSDVFVILKPRKEWRHGMTPDKLADDLGDRADRTAPATVHAFSQPIEMRVNDLIAGVKSDIAVKVFGDDLAQMQDAAEKIRKTLASIPGSQDVRMEIPTGQPSLQVKVDRSRVGRLGVTASSVLDVLTMSKAGLEVGQVREGERVFDLMLRMGGKEVDDTGDIARLPITTANGDIVPMSMVADMVEERTVVLIGREQMRRRLIVQANVRDRDMVGFVKEAQEKVKASFQFPKTIEIVWGGQFQNFNRAKDRLMMLVPVALGIIAILLVITYRGFWYMVATVLNLPFAIGGGLIGLVIRGLPFSIPAGVGFIALCGVSVMTGIVLTSRLLEVPRDMPAKERVRVAAAKAFRAPLSTALVAAVGFIPAATATGTGAEVQRPLATVVIAGLIVSMLMSLIVLPAMLLFIAKKEEDNPLGDESMPDLSALAGEHE